MTLTDCLWRAFLQRGVIFDVIVSALWVLSKKTGARSSCEMLAHRVIKMRIRRLFVYISFDCYHVTCCSLWELFKIDNGWGYIPVVNPSNKISTCTTWRHTLVLPLLTCSRSQKLAKKIKSKSTCSLIYSAYKVPVVLYCKQIITTQMGTGEQIQFTIQFQ